MKKTWLVALSIRFIPIPLIPCICSAQNIKQYNQPIYLTVIELPIFESSKPYSEKDNTGECCGAYSIDDMKFDKERWN